MKQPAPFCPECGFPVQRAEGKTYLATNTWNFMADGTPEDTYQFRQTTTYACPNCRVVIVFPIYEDVS